MGIGGAIVGGLIQKDAAGDAADAQQAAADRQIQYQEETRDIVRGDLAPWREGGTLAQGALMNMLGLGSAPRIGGTAPTIETIYGSGSSSAGGVMGSGGPSMLGGNPDGMVRYGQGEGRDSDKGWRPVAPAAAGAGSPTGYSVNGQTFATMEDAQAYANANMTGGEEWSWQTDPGYEFRLGEGQKAIEASAAARGGLYSGATMRDALKYGQDYGSAEFGNVFNRLAGVSGTGMGAAQMSGNASMQAAGNIGNALGAAGNAQAAGYIGQGNAFNNALGNAYGVMNYQRQIGGGSGSGGNSSIYNPLFGGPGLGNLF